MPKTLALIAALGLSAAAGCTQNIQPTELDRTIIGAASGAVIADMSGRSVTKGAAIGALGGALCDDVRLCQ